jgi:hypothetical protein
MKKYIPILLIAAMACSSAQLSAKTFGFGKSDYAKLKFTDADAEKREKKLKADSNKLQAELQKKLNAMKNPQFKQHVVDVVDTCKKRMGAMFANMLAEKMKTMHGLTSPGELKRWTLSVYDVHYSNVKDLIKGQMELITQLDKIDATLVGTEQKHARRVARVKTAAAKAEEARMKAQQKAAAKAAKRRK